MKDLARPGTDMELKSSGGKRLYLLAGLLAVAGLAALWIDLPVAQRFLPVGTADRSWPQDLRKCVDLAEVFGHGYGIFLIGLTILLLDRRHRRALLRFSLVMAATGLLVKGIKTLVVSRTRPYAFSFEGGVAATFTALFSPARTEAIAQSFPSGHAAGAAAVAVMLSWLYPQGRWLFVALAVLAGFQRVKAGEHFPSDVFWGAAIGCLTAALFLQTRWLGRFERGSKNGGA